ncbi:keratin, type I cytoskeletal 9-like [Macrobrachium nipponense]|uniref:keratin, type I cytoskeletal 9-like n=1 Tax=Macrobrachium nipponense TaxID=159736 RepID=UPI0030C89333
MPSKTVIATFTVVLFGIVAAGPVAEPEPEANPGFHRGFGGGFGGFGGHGFGYGGYRGKRSPVAEAEPGFHRGFGGGFGGFGGHGFGYGGYRGKRSPVAEAEPGLTIEDLVEDLEDFAVAIDSIWRLSVERGAQVLKLSPDSIEDLVEDLVVLVILEEADIMPPYPNPCPPNPPNPPPKPLWNPGSASGSGSATGLLFPR